MMLTGRHDVHQTLILFTRCTECLYNRMIIQVLHELRNVGIRGCSEFLRKLSISCKHFMQASTKLDLLYLYTNSLSPCFSRCIVSFPFHKPDATVFSAIFTPFSRKPSSKLQSTSSASCRQSSMLFCIRFAMLFLFLFGYTFVSAL